MKPRYYSGYLIPSALLLCSSGGLLTQEIQCFLPAGRVCAYGETTKDEYSNPVPLPLRLPITAYNGYAFSATASGSQFVSASPYLPYYQA